jgi:prepilin-type N-terminal cleavage/methylation domain-containing protein
VRRNGFTLLELLTVVAIIGIIALVSMPAFSSYRRNASMKAEVAELRGIFRAVRSRAIARGQNAGVKFTRVGNLWTYSLYDDTNGNGIRTADITKGVDRRYFGPSILMPQFNIAGIALLDKTIRDPDGDKLAPSDSAVQFGSSTICSFSPTGSGTPGTIYITDGAGQLCALRVYGASGRVRVLRYNAANNKWSQE